ncbi:DoxX family protein [Mycolicibacterium iranicum]|uniref:DoxX family protein n=1 Tax=Mycolicibacterium iranicum TaxID=912594 RepID=A0A1X1WKN9_MYCIR|nr:DoxX family protein [Mycolicibacterium iranicum]ORV87134.1 DoxX family protein [Mycolicibacterium iranicum]
MTDTTTRVSPDTAVNTGLLILRLGIGAAILQAGLIKAADFGMTVQFLTDAGWRLPGFAAFMVTATETLAGIGLLLGVLTPLAGSATLGAMLCAWAVNVSGSAFWSEPFNVPFLIGLGGAALLFTGAGAYSVDARVLGRLTWSPRVKLALLALAFVAAVVTWLALYGSNPIHFTAPPAPPGQ